METKKCNKCGEIKSTTEFAKRALSPDNLQSNCKSCNKLESKQFRDKNPLYKKIWDKNNPGRQNEIVKEWSKNNPDKKIRNLLKNWQSWGGGVYRVYNKITNDSYIGSSVQLRQRKYAHWSGEKSSSNKYLQEDFIKYGKKAFEFQILHKCDDETEMRRLEIDYIKLLKPSYNIAHNS
jgi:hypothetical protein